MEINQITEKIIGAAIEIHKTPGPGLLESAYMDKRLGLLINYNVPDLRDGIKRMANRL